MTSIFNSKYSNYYIGKTFVSYTLKNHKYEILQLRKKIKNRLAYFTKFNQIWGIDLTFINQKPILGIKHQTTKVHSPWENGRVERLFKTFKSTIFLFKYDKDNLDYLCYSFEFWYNNIRLHQNLAYKTPEFIYQRNIDEILKE